MRRTIPPVAGAVVGILVAALALVIGFALVNRTHPAAPLTPTGPTRELAKYRRSVMESYFAERKRAREQGLPEPARPDPRAMTPGVATGVQGSPTQQTGANAVDGTSPERSSGFGEPVSGR